MNLQKGFGVMVVLIIIALLAVAGEGVYIAVKQKGQVSLAPETNSQQLQNDNQVTTTSTNSNSNKQPLVNTDSKVALGPEEAYLRMKAEFDKTQTFSDIYAFTLKYGTKSNIAKIQAQKNQIDALPQEFKDSLVAQMKALNPTLSEITTIQATTNGNNSTLKVSSTKPGTAGTVLMVYEDNEWKIDKESWKQSL